MIMFFCHNNLGCIYRQGTEDKNPSPRVGLKNTEGDKKYV